MVTELDVTCSSENGEQIAHDWLLLHYNIASRRICVLLELFIHISSSSTRYVYNLMHITGLNDFVRSFISVRITYF